MARFYHLLPFEKLKKGSKVVLYGAGEVGQWYLEQLKLTGYAKVVAVVDRKWSYYGSMEAPLMAPDELLVLDYDQVLICIEKCDVAMSVADTLEQSYGIPRDKIVLGNDSLLAVPNFLKPADKKPKLLDADGQYATIERKILNGNRLNICFWINGGIGDLLMNANYVFYFAEKYAGEGIVLDVSTPGDVGFVRGLFPAGVVHEVYKEGNPPINMEQYDLYVKISRYPQVRRVQNNKISEYCPDLFEWIFSCQRFEAENPRFKKWTNVNDNQHIMLNLLQKRTRIKQPDLYGFLGVNTHARVHPRIVSDEVEFLERHGLEMGNFLTLHRGVDTRYIKDSIKQWPHEYYVTLVKLLKKEFPQLTLVQMGASAERCPIMEGVDISLVGKTSLEEVSILLKHSLLHIDGEGGMAHLRHALGEKPSIILFGPTSEDFYGYEENINIRGNGCAHWCEWCWDKWSESCIRGYEKPPCMYSIFPEMVFEKAKEFLEVVSSEE